GNKGLVGHVFQRNILLIEAETKGATSLGGLVKSFEAEARAAGATRLTVTGHAVINPGFTARLAARDGFDFPWLHKTSLQVNQAQLRADKGLDAMPAEDLVARLLWHFRKSGGGGRQVRPFGELPPELQSQLAAAASLPGDELPIVVCYRNASSWVLLTTRRLIWAEDGRLT